MRQKRFTLAAAISLVLCLAVAWTWRHPRSSGGVRHAIMELGVGGRVVELSEVGGTLMLGCLPGDHRQIEAQTQPPGVTNKSSVWGLPGVAGVISVRSWNGHRAVGIIAA